MDTELVVICSHPPYSIDRQLVPVHSRIFWRYRTDSYLFTSTIFYRYRTCTCSQPQSFCKDRTGGNCTQLPLSINIELLRFVHILHYLSIRNSQCLFKTSTFYQYRSVSINPHSPLSTSTEVSVSVHTPHFLSIQNCQYQSTSPNFYRYRTVSVCPQRPLSIDTELSMSVHNVHFLPAQKS
jgi:hypothetical protein